MDNIENTIKILLLGVVGGVVAGFLAGRGSWLVIRDLAVVNEQATGVLTDAGAVGRDHSERNPFRIQSRSLHGQGQRPLLRAGETVITRAFYT